MEEKRRAAVGAGWRWIRESELGRADAQPLFDLAEDTFPVVAQLGGRVMRQRQAVTGELVVAAHRSPPLGFEEVVLAAVDFEDSAELAPQDVRDGDHDALVVDKRNIELEFRQAGR